jgi:hypothetical protein
MVALKGNNRYLFPNSIQMEIIDEISNFHIYDKKAFLKITRTQISG